MFPSLKDSTITIDKTALSGLSTPGVVISLDTNKGYSLSLAANVSAPEAHDAKWQKGENFKAYGLCLVVSIIIFAFVFNEYGHINIAQGFVPKINIPAGFLRGLADMGLGIFCANFSIRLNNKKVVVLLKILFPVLLFVLILYAAETAIDFVFIFLCAFALIFEFSIEETPCKLVQSICRFAGKISIPIYFSHAFVLIIVYTPVIQKWTSLTSNFLLDLFVRAVLVGAFSFIFYWISKLLEKPLNRLYSCFVSKVEAE